MSAAAAELHATLVRPVARLSVRVAAAQPFCVVVVSNQLSFSADARNLVRPLCRHSHFGQRAYGRSECAPSFLRGDSGGTFVTLDRFAESTGDWVPVPSLGIRHIPQWRLDSHNVRLLVAPVDQRGVALPAKNP
jgi:hypothetical protein